MQLQGCWSALQLEGYVLFNNIDKDMLLKIFQTLPPTISFNEKKDLMERILQNLDVQITAETWNRFIQCWHDKQSDQPDIPIRIKMYKAGDGMDNQQSREIEVNDTANPLREQRVPLVVPLNVVRDTTVTDDLPTHAWDTNNTKKFPELAFERRSFTKKPELYSLDDEDSVEPIFEDIYNKKDSSDSMSTSLFYSQPLTFLNKQSQKEKVFINTDNSSTEGDSAAGVLKTTTADPLQLILEQMTKFNNSHSEQLSNIDTKLNTQAIEILQKVDEKQEAFKTDLIITLYGKIEQSGTKIANKILGRVVELLEIEQRNQTQRFERLMLQNSPEQHHLLECQSTIGDSSYNTKLTETNTNSIINSGQTRY